MAKRNASSASRWLACPGSIALCDGIKNESSVYAEEGTQAHEVAELAVKTSRINTDDVEMAAAVQMYLDYVQDVRKGNVVFERVEVHYRSKDVDGLSGKIDYLALELANKHLWCHAADFKYGKGVAVSAVDNKQLLSYFLLTQERFLGMVDRFRGAIIQPRSFDDAGVKIAEYTKADVDAHYDDIMYKMGDDTLNVGEWCHWCPAMTICPKMKQETKALAKRPVAELVPPEDDAMLLEIYEKSPAIRKFLDKVEEVMIERVKRGAVYPGYKAVHRQGNRQWTETPENIASNLAMDLEEISTVKMMTPAAVEKLGGDKQKIAKMTTRALLGAKIVKENARGIELKNLLNEVTEL